MQRGSIPNPCPRQWPELKGNDQKRYCAECGLHVHAIAAYSDAEWAALLKQGPVCAYTEGESTPAARTRRAIVAGALLTTISPLLAQSAQLKVAVIDATGATIANAEVTLQCADGSERKQHTDTSGNAAFTGLPLGNCEIRISSPGFVLWRKVESLANADNTLRAKLAVGEVTMGVFVVAPRRKWYKLWRRA